jgi:cytochrome d ubiquinol oxidase subunit II
MSLADVPLVLLLVGLAAYAVLGGADFGAGFWQLTAFGSKSRRQQALREHAHQAMGPVWEANHVWLIFVLVVCWTAYPVAFASIASTLAVPLFIAAVGIVLRGTTYALRSGTETPREQRRLEVLFSASSILTPFALGAAIGGIASGRVPVGNAKGDLASSWLNPTSALVGAIAVATAAYLAAVYLAGDAVRIGAPELAVAFRKRALGAGVIAGGIALGGLAILHSDARPIWDGLTSGAGVAAVVVSVLAGLATMALVWRSHFEPARVSAALAVAAIVAGWALAQRPRILPGLTISEAAAGRSTLVAVIVGVAIGAVVLAPSLGLLFGLFLRGRLDHAPDLGPAPIATRPMSRRGFGSLRASVLVAALLAGVGLTMFADPSWARAVGIVALLSFVAGAFVWIATPRRPSDDETSPPYS